MIVCSSYRPFAESAEIAENQRRAKISWEEHFEDIVYFGEPEPELESKKTEFIRSEQFPRIRALADYLAMPGYRFGAIVNADIVIGPNFPKVEAELIARNAKAGISRRFQFNDPATPFVADMVDLGLDFFFAIPAMWRMISLQIPEQFRMGHCLWDTWVMAFMSHWAGTDCYDLTPQRFVFHPNHGNRKTQYTIDTEPDKTLTRLTWPKGRLRCCLKR
jgi:hypothetical protein